MSSRHLSKSVRECCSSSPPVFNSLKMEDCSRCSRFILSKFPCKCQKNRKRRRRISCVVLSGDSIRDGSGSSNNFGGFLWIFERLADGQVRMSERGSCQVRLPCWCDGYRAWYLIGFLNHFLLKEFQHSLLATWQFRFAAWLVIIFNQKVRLKAWTSSSWWSSCDMTSSIFKSTWISLSLFLFRPIWQLDMIRWIYFCAVSTRGCR